jgi:hypothetical protein
MILAKWLADHGYWCLAPKMTDLGDWRRRYYSLPAQSRHGIAVAHFFERE